MSRRSPQSSVALFPFLAVLMCALGALILLLVVINTGVSKGLLVQKDQPFQKPRSSDAEPLALQPTTPTIESEPLPDPFSEAPTTEAAATLSGGDTLKTEPAAVDSVSNAGPQPQEPLETPAVAQVTPDVADESDAADEAMGGTPYSGKLLDENPDAPSLAHQPRRRWTAPRVEPIRPLTPEEEAERTEWLARVQELETRQANLQRLLNEARQAAEREEQHLRQLKSRAEANKARNDVSRLERDQLQEAMDQALAQKPELDAQVTALSKQLRELRGHNSSRFSVVAYDGTSGTTRRPILIECRSDGLAFPSEGVEIPPQDLDGFTAKANPLLAVTDALRKFWTEKDGTAPYVLLLVRSEGTVGYYVARKLLSGNPEAFGYELLAPGQEIDWPTSPPEVQELAQEALRTARHGAASGMTNSTDGGPGLPTLDPFLNSNASARSVGDPQTQYSRGGQFHLAEIDAVRRNEEEQSLRYGGERIAFARPKPRGDSTTPPSPTAPGHSTGLRDNRNPEAPKTKTVSTRPGPTTVPGLEDLGTAHPHRELADSTPADTLRWGASQPGATIGLEKDVEVEISATRMTIGGQWFIPLDDQVTSEEMRPAFAEALQKHAHSWGTASRSFFWQPAIDIHVLPGGTAHARRLKAISEAWGLRTQVQRAK